MSKSDAVTILATERHEFKSSMTGKTYELMVALPYNYHADAGSGGPFRTQLDAYPVVYLTDANWHFGMVTDFVREAAWCGRTWDAIVVGIGYAEEETPQETWRSVSQLRASDLTPVASEVEDRDGEEWLGRPVKTGGADRFLECLKEELLPWVEERYRADVTKRVLVGHSYGGLFALYALYQVPGLFGSYIAASPYLRNQEDVLAELEPELAGKFSGVVTKLFFAAGELENSEQDSTLTDMQEVAALLEGKRINELEIKTQVMADCNHCEAVAPALHAGLKWVLRK